MISKENIEEKLYCEDNKLYWKVSRGSRRKGQLAGFIDHSGYITIKINGKRHLAHRLIWTLLYGACPDFLDHKNGDRTDNDPANLREATKQQNAHNYKIPNVNTSGYKGIDRRHNKWRVRIKLNNKSIHIGYYQNLEDAISSMQTARIKYHGEFARHA